MLVAHTNGESHPAIKRGRAIEIVNSVDDVIEAARHESLLPAKARTRAS
jgi:hypothetical protein